MSKKRKLKVYILIKIKIKYLTKKEILKLSKIKLI